MGFVVAAIGALIGAATAAVATVGAAVTAGVATITGGILGATATGIIGSALTGALVGGLTSALTGGDWETGAIFGAIGGGLSSALTGTATTAGEAAISGVESGASFSDNVLGITDALEVTEKVAAIKETVGGEIEAVSNGAVETLQSGGTNIAEKSLETAGAEGTGLIAQETTKSITEGSLWDNIVTDIFDPIVDVLGGPEKVAEFGLKAVEGYFEREKYEDMLGMKLDADLAYNDAKYDGITAASTPDWLSAGNIHPTLTAPSVGDYGTSAPKVIAPNVTAPTVASRPILSTAIPGVS